jgi:hypothetical protein
MDGISPWSLHVQESFDYILCSDDDLYPCDVPAVNRLPILSDFHAMPPIRKVEYHGEFFPGRQGQSCDQTCRDLGACTAWPCSAERTITTPHHTTPHHTTLHDSTAQHSALHNSTAQCTTVQRMALQHSTAHYRAPQCCCQLGSAATWHTHLRSRAHARWAHIQASVATAVESSSRTAAT